jgi:cytoskeletal protein CcmA (bactofilin family)
VSAKMGEVMSTTGHTLRSWRRDLKLFFTELFCGASAPRNVPMWDGKKLDTPAVTKLQPSNLHVNHSRLGPSLFVKGEIFGNEDLLIDGSVEGVIRLSERKLMIGPAANVKADIIAAEVVIRGNLKGNVRARGRIEIGNDGSVTGDLTTPQVFVEDGALFKGSIEIEKNTQKETDEHALSKTESAAKVTAAAAGATSDHEAGLTPTHHRSDLSPGNVSMPRKSIIVLP